MENSYGIGVCNRYALFLNDESDPLEILKEKEQEKELKKKNKVAEKENKIKNDVAPQVNKGKQATPGPKKPPKDSVALTKTPDIKRDENKLQHRGNNTDGKPERNFTKFNENREERNNRRNREDRQFNGTTDGNRDREDRPPRRENFGNDNNFENRNRGGRNLANRDGTGPRGGSKGRNFDNNRRGKREFDRQSGSDKTGVKPIDKRDGGGAHNWGSDKDIIEDADKITTETDQTWVDSGKNDSGISTDAKDNTGEVEVEATPEIEEPKELTLDEWKAQRSGRAKPQYNIRKAGEGEDQTQWKKMYELKKKESNEDESDDEEFDASEYPQRVGRQKHVLDIDIHFNDARRAGIGRGRGPRVGGRGGPRPNRDNNKPRFRGNEEQGGGGGGGNSQDEASQRTEKAPKVDDERDFPSLG